jgi:hypothetical protein
MGNFMIFVTVFYLAETSMQVSNTKAGNALVSGKPRTPIPGDSGALDLGHLQNNTKSPQCVAT